MRNLNKPPRYNVASIQAQQTLGGDVMQADENGNYVEWRDYQWLLTEKQRLDAECQARQAENSVLAVECDSLKIEVERLTELNDTLSLRYDATKSMLDGCAKEIEEMEAEVERLTTENESLQAKATNIYNAMVVRCKVEEITHKANADSIISQGMMSEAMKMMEESVAIREQVERLTKCWVFGLMK